MTVICFVMRAEHKLHIFKRPR